MRPLPDWLDGPWSAAFDANVAAARRREPRFDRIVDAVARSGSPMRLADALAVAVRNALPWVFTGERHEILSMAEAVRRGSAACADGAAVAAAALLVARERGFVDVVVDGVRVRRTVALCYETVVGSSTYAHVRVLLNGRPVEPWPEVRRPEATGCTRLWDVDVDEEKD